MWSRVQPSSPEASRRLAKVRQQGTAAETAIRRELHRSGLRYRVAQAVMKSPRRVADIVFPRLKIAVFVDGCFWHGCPEHASWPKQNADFWRQKIETNRARDTDTDARLGRLGWKVIRVWEHESSDVAARRISDLVVETKASGSKASLNVEIAG